MYRLPPLSFLQIIIETVIETLVELKALHHVVLAESLETVDEEKPALLTTPVKVQHFIYCIHKCFLKHRLGLHRMEST